MVKGTTEAKHMDHPERIRVLHVVDSLKLGGVQTTIEALLRSVDHSQFDLSLAALHGPGVFSERIEAIGITPIHLSRHRLNPLIPFRLRHLLRANQYDIVHAHGMPSCFVCERFRQFLGIQRLVAHIHHVYRGQHGQTLQNMLEHTVYRRTDLLLGCSQEALDSVSTALPKQVLHNGIDTIRFSPAIEASKASVRQEWGLSDGDFVVGTTGRITHKKDPFILCRMLDVLGAEFPELRLLIVGSGPEEQALRDYAQELGVRDRIVFTGYQPEVEQLLAAMDVYVIASHQEGLALSLIEAMACGLPCVVSDYPGSKEIVAPEHDALQFVCREVDALCGHIRRLITDKALCNSLGTAARETACERFSDTVMAEALSNIYRELMG